MEVKLVITATKDHDPTNPVGKRYEFKDEPAITIGRGEPNNVPLTDPGRTVSRNHARLVASESGYMLEDLNSKNFTYLNSERLESGQQRGLKNGDVISVGDFSMEYSQVASRDVLDETVIDPLALQPDYARDNPFMEPIETVFQALKRVCDLYDEQQKETRADYLTYAIQQTLPNYEGHKALNIFINSFSDTEIGHPTQARPPASDVAESTLPGAGEAKGYVSPVLDVVLASLKQLIRIPYEFRGEFVGHTMWQDEESTFLYEGDYKVTKNYLLDASSSPEQLKRKLERLKKASGKVAVHQVGMLEGYMAIVREGLHHALMEIDPAAIEQEVLETNLLFRIFPVLASKKVLDNLEEKIAQLKVSDWGVTEQRVFRPVFIRAYMAAISQNDQE